MRRVRAHNTLEKISRVERGIVTSRSIASHSDHPSQAMPSATGSSSSSRGGSSSSKKNELGATEKRIYQGVLDAPGQVSCTTDLHANHRYSLTNPLHYPVTLSRRGHEEVCRCRGRQDATFHQLSSQEGEQVALVPSSHSLCSLPISPSSLSLACTRPTEGRGIRLSPRKRPVCESPGHLPRRTSPRYSSPPSSPQLGIFGRR